MRSCKTLFQWLKQLICNIVFNCAILIACTLKISYQFHMICLYKIDFFHVYNSLFRPIIFYIHFRSEYIYVDACDSLPTGQSMLLRFSTTEKQVRTMPTTAPDLTWVLCGCTQNFKFILEW